MVDIKAKIDKGWVHARFLVELVGKPKEHIEKTAHLYIDRIRQDKNIDLIRTDIGTIDEVKDMEGFYGVILEVEALMPSITMVAGFCFDYMPASIEIIEPQNLIIKARDVSSFFNELQSKLHQLDMVIKQVRMENDYQKKNTHQLLQNIVNLILLNGSYTAGQMANTVGLPEEQMKGFLEHLVKLNKLEKDGEQYKLPKDDKREK